MMIEPLVASYGTDQCSLPVSGSTALSALGRARSSCRLPPTSMIVGGE